MMEYTRSSRNLGEGIVRVTLVLAVLLICGLSLDFALGLPRFASYILAVFGTVVLGFGIALEVSATWVLWTVGFGTPNPVDPPRVLVTIGPYRFSRNPLYLARLTILAGAGAIFGSIGVVLVAACLFAGLNALLVPREETRLIARHGRLYEDYSARVPRWIPLPSTRGRDVRTR